jgi:two-component system nitrogen regulation sensor histidine kinase NtrY
MAEQDPILVTPDASRERRRRQRELYLAAAALLAVLGAVLVSLRTLGASTSVFLGLTVFLSILLVLILFVLVRNLAKLMVERRRRVLGSRLRSRLVLAFTALSLGPTLVMFLVGTQFVRTSVDYWFKSQVDNSLEQALEVGQAFYIGSQERLERRARHLLARIREGRLSWGGKSMDQFMDTKREEYDLSLLGVLSPERAEQNWRQTEDWTQAWPEAKAAIGWDGLAQRPDFFSTILPGPTADMVVGVLPVDGGKTGYLVLGESIGKGLLYRLDQIVRGVGEYKKLQTMKYPLKVALYMGLALISLLVVFGAVWFGFKLAKEISSPVQALAQATERIAKGDLQVRLVDESRDELGLLVQSFNRMAEDLSGSRDELTQANRQLHLQNLELAARGQYIEALLDNITAGVVSLDATGRVTTLNRAAEALLGTDSGQAVGRRPIELDLGAFSELLAEAGDRPAADLGPGLTRQITLSAAGRDLKLLVNVVPLRDEAGAHSGLVAVFEDITELEKMQRLDAWKEVARLIAHEIKNPLTPIKLSAQRIAHKFGERIDDPVLTQCTDLIVRQVEHLQQMVAEFSTFARLPEVALAPDLLPPILDEVVQTFQHSHTSIAWTLQMDPDLPELLMDRSGMRHVLVNILSNAAEALKDQAGGAVEVRTKYEPSLGRVRLEVRDNGPGLTSEERSRVFEPYFSRKKGGTGLGLTIVKSIVSDHHGVVRVRPNHPRGTVLVVDLPAPQGRPAA